MRLMLERQFLPDGSLIFPVPLIFPQRAELLPTSIITVLRRRPLIWRIIILVLSILLKKMYIRKYGCVIGLLEVNLTEGYLMGGYE